MRKVMGTASKDAPARMIARLSPPIREPLLQQLPVASVLVSNSMRQLTEMGTDTI
jgi:hypothetical protein